jgi:GT2 family glycosyltransferase
MADVFCVIVSYKNPGHTMNAITSAAAQSLPTRVIVWDNNSPDGSGEVLANRPWPDNVEIVQSPTNLLWSPAINAAVRDHWDGERLLAFMNNDITLPPRAFGILETIFRQHPTAGMVAPMGWNLGGPGDYATHKAEWASQNPRTPENWFDKEPPRRATYLIGACTLLPKSVWDTVGELDEEMPLGADDHDYSLRLKEAGYSLWVHPGVCIDHAGHASGHEPEWDAWGGKSWARFNEKWAGYFAGSTDEEPINCHWNGWYVPGWDKGTGWLSEADREAVWRERAR